MLPSCVCSLACSYGDAGPELWTCPQHGKTGLIWTHFMRKRMVEKLGVTYDGAWDIMMEYCKERTRACMLAGEIYFSEDLLQSELTQTFFPPVPPPELPPPPTLWQRFREWLRGVS